MIPVSAISKRPVTLSQSTLSGLLKELGGECRHEPPASPAQSLLLTNSESASSLTTVMRARPCKKRRMVYDSLTQLQLQENEPLPQQHYRPTCSKESITDVWALHELPNRLDAVSLHSLHYFEAYQEGRIPGKLLLTLKEGSGNVAARLEKDFSRKELECHNQFGETLLHLICRWNLNKSATLVCFLLDTIKLPLNVRDRHGRTPLHNACVAVNSSRDGDQVFDVIRVLIERAPELLLFEDHHGNTPLDLLETSNNESDQESWARFWASLDLNGIACQARINLELPGDSMTGSSTLVNSESCSGISIVTTSDDPV